MQPQGFRASARQDVAAPETPAPSLAPPAPSPVDLPSRHSRALLAEIRRLARFVSVPVCFVGPSGTGKTLYARELHRASPRRDGPFVYLNLAGIPPGLIASELRGHRRGAFTGATERRAGRVLTASGGTMVLDEITKSLHEVQHELLPLFDRTPLTPVGADRDVIVDVRLVALSSVPLAAAVRSGSLIPDLFERLKPFALTITPLHERKQDILAVLEWAVRHHAKEFGYQSAPALDPLLMSHLENQRFTGNHRELDGLAQRMLVNADGAAVLTLRHLPILPRNEIRSLQSSRETWLADRASASPPRFRRVDDEATHYDVSSSTIHRWRKEESENKGFADRRDQSDSTEAP